MIDKLCTLLGIDSGEESMVSMLLTQSVFLGIFFGSFDISAHSLFLSVFDEKILARAYVLSGLSGILIIYIYSAFQKKIKFRNLSVISFIVISVISALLWFALIISHAKWIVFVGFILLGPLNIVALLGLWGTVDRIFSRSQIRRLFGLVDTGLIAGIILISYIIALLISVRVQSHSLLLLSTFSVLVAAIIQIPVGSHFSMVKREEEPLAEKPDKNKNLFRVFLEDPYIRTIIIFSALSVISAFFIQYSFLAVTREQFPVAEDMAGFLGLFTGCVMLFILVMKMVVFTHVFHNYSLQICLIVSPLVIALLTAIIILLGLFSGSASQAAGGFTVFFILLAFNRLMSRSLRESMEIPSFKVIFQSIDIRLKLKLQNGMAGSLNELMVLISGLILTGLGLITFFKLIHFLFFLLAISLIWLYVAFRLFREYRKSVKIATEMAARAIYEVNISNRQDIFRNRFSAYIAFRKDYFRLITGDYSGLSKIRSKWYLDRIIESAYSNKDLNLLPVLKKTSSNTSIDDAVRQRSSEVIEILQQHSVSFSPADEKITEAIRVLSGTRMPQTTEILRLLRDSSIESKRLAIYMIGKFRLSDLLSEVCECLSIPQLTIDAAEVLKTFGSDVEDDLVRYYLVTSGNTRLSKTLLQLLGTTCSKETVAFLFSRLFSNSRQLKEVAVKCLINCRFSPADEEKLRLDQLISDVIGLLTWNLSAKISFVRDNDNFLLGQINRETARWHKFLFDILSITYNQGSIARIRESLESNTLETVSYGLEMTEMVVSDTIRLKLISLLDVVPDEVKLRNLVQFFPGEISERKKLLEDIINRDYNLISLWMKACVLRSISDIEGNDLSESVMALLFSPEEIIQEESAYLISRLKPDLYHSASGRIPDQIRKRLDNIIDKKIKNEELLYEKVLFLSKYFGGIPEDELLPLASEMSFVTDPVPEFSGTSEGFIIWPLSKTGGADKVFVLYNGEIDKTIGHKYSGRNDSYYILPLNSVEEYNFQFPEKSFEILEYIDNNEDTSKSGD
jgi:AAA family ATP:ADP antiporter